MLKPPRTSHNSLPNHHASLECCQLLLARWHHYLYRSLSLSVLVNPLTPYPALSYKKRLKWHTHIALISHYCYYGRYGIHDNAQMQQLLEEHAPGQADDTTNPTSDNATNELPVPYRGGKGKVHLSYKCRDKKWSENHAHAWRDVVLLLVILQYYKIWDILELYMTSNEQCT